MNSSSNAKMEKLQAKINKKILFTEFGYRRPAKEPWTESQNNINNASQCESFFKA
jgi:hypothetical protein